jgi:C4-dicarboxylate-specific signal transduction histidine kinase
MSGPIAVVEAFSSEATARRIRELESEIRQDLQNAVLRAIECGKLLNEAFAMIPPGEWPYWLENSCHLNRQSVYEYRRIARYSDYVLESGVPSIRAAMQLLREDNKGLPAYRPSLFDLDERILEQVRDGSLARREAAEILGCSVTTVANRLDPAARRERVRRHKQKIRQTREAQRQQERDLAVKDAGGDADTLYTFIRQKGFKLLEKAQREAKTSDQRKHLEMAQRRLYEVEDELVKAAKLA